MSSAKKKGKLETKYHSFKSGAFPKGCTQCVLGRKSVLFITGICSANCYFCPISEQKMNKDVIYINEMPASKFSDVVKEIKLCSSTGVGITGGDPLSRLTRTVSYIKRLKKEFGASFHIHLYTPLVMVSHTVLKKLYDAGLDEIRFHPSLENRKYWGRISTANSFDWSVGVEIPAVPGKMAETKALVDFISDKVSFLNINELEYSDTNQEALTSKGFFVKDNLSYGIKGSAALGLKALDYAKDKIKNVHYCTATLKDKVQLAKRIKLRASNTARVFDIITDDGTFLRGAIYFSELRPCSGYNKKLAKIKSDKAKVTKVIANLRKLRLELMKDFEIDSGLIEVDKEKLRLITNIGIVRGLAYEISKMALTECTGSAKMSCSEELFLAEIEEYPTWDGFLVSVEYL